MERNRKGSPYSSDYSVHHCSPSKWFLSSVSRRSTMPKARPLASQYPVLKVRAAGRFGAARQGDILPYPGRRGGRLSRPPRFLHILCRQAIESIRSPIPTAFTIAEALEDRGRPGRMPDALRLKASVQPCAGRRGMGPRRGVGQGAARRKERSRHRHAPEAPTGLSV